MEGTKLHYTTEVYAGTDYLYGSLDPTGRDNSAWFIVYDYDEGRALEGSFEDIYSEGYFANGFSYQSHSGVIDLAGRESATLDVLTGASFMIGPDWLECDSTVTGVGDGSGLPY